MNRETWEAMTAEERKAWRERKKRRDYIVFSIIVPILITVASSLLLCPWFVRLFLHK